MKKTHIIGIIVIALAIAAILTTVADSSTYATFTEAQASPDNEFHVVGKLSKNKPLEYNPEVNANLFGFYMVDNNGVERKVLFNGTKPQDFERSEQIVITGQCSDSEFKATKILMKCPSKYNDGSEMKVLEAKS
ncbi:MAG: cytochrome c maturation protein CcmE [Bacteroidota bacterium]